MVLQQIVLELSLDQQPLSSMAERSILKVLSYCPNASMCKKNRRLLTAITALTLLGRTFFFSFSVSCCVTLL